MCVGADVGFSCVVAVDAAGVAGISVLDGGNAVVVASS